MGCKCGKYFSSDEEMLVLKCIRKLDDAAFVLVRTYDGQKGLIDSLGNLVDHRELRVNKMSTDIHDLQKQQEVVTTQMGTTMSCICEMFEMTQKKLKKGHTVQLKLYAYLEEEKLLPNANLGSLQHGNGKNKKGTSNPTDKKQGETSTLTESSPLLPKNDRQDNECVRGIDDTSASAERKEKDMLEPRCTNTLHVIKSEEKELEDTCKPLSTKLDEVLSNINMLMPKLDSTNQLLEEEKSKNRSFSHEDVHKLEEQKLNSECTSKLYEEKLDIQLQLQEALHKNEQFEISIEKLKRTLKNNEEQLQEKTISLDRMATEKANASEHAKEVHLALDKTKEDLFKTEAQLEHEKHERKQTEAELKEINTSLKEKEHQIQEALEQDKIKYEATVFDLQQKIISLEQQNQSLVEASELLAKRLTEENVLRVQVYCPSQSGLMLEVEKEMMSLIQAKLENRAKEFKFVKCINIAEVNQSLPTLLLCINTSRLGTDVSTILQKFQANSKMAVIVFHHKDEHALPNESSSRVLIGQEFKLLGGIFDMAFLTGKGIYSCQMNEDNISKLIQFIVNLL